MKGRDTKPIHDYFGYRKIQNTTRYTALALDRFKVFGSIERVCN
ncbi:MAG TPA: hypothetical protein VGJ20_30865 [Xanthobacteraceae bacterium]|jgi:hypothetical protein